MRGSVSALHDADESDSDRSPEVSQTVEAESRPLDLPIGAETAALSSGNRGADRGIDGADEGERQGEPRLRAT